MRAAHVMPSLEPVRTTARRPNQPRYRSRQAPKCQRREAAAKLSRLALLVLAGGAFGQPKVKVYALDGCGKIERTRRAIWNASRANKNGRIRNADQSRTAPPRFNSSDAPHPKTAARSLALTMNNAQQWRSRASPESA